MITYATDNEYSIFSSFTQGINISCKTGLEMHYHGLLSHTLNENTTNVY